MAEEYFSSLPQHLPLFNLCFSSRETLVPVSVCHRVAGPRLSRKRDEQHLDKPDASVQTKIPTQAHILLVTDTWDSKTSPQPSGGCHSLQHKHILLARELLLRCSAPKHHMCYRLKKLINIPQTWPRQLLLSQCPDLRLLHQLCQ